MGNIFSGERFLWYLLRLTRTGDYMTIQLKLNKYKQVERGSNFWSLCDNVIIETSQMMDLE